jgi:hypothetical protein
MGMSEISISAERASVRLLLLISLSLASILVARINAQIVLPEQEVAKEPTDRPPPRDVVYFFPTRPPRAPRLKIEASGLYDSNSLRNDLVKGLWRGDVLGEELRRLLES